MADEGNLGLARALDTEEDPTKADLQRRMEEARESITQTVTEIKDTVTNQYNSVKESVSDALDWREQYRKRPLAFTLGALGVGVVVGYNLGGVVTGDRETSDSVLSDQASPSAFTNEHSYAAHARGTDNAEYQSLNDSLSARPSYSSGYEQTPAVDDKPGLMERFKETRAYDRLQEEVSDLGNRFMDELSNAARTVVLPAIFAKIKEMVGIDLGNKRAATDQPRSVGSLSTASQTPAVGTTSAQSAVGQPAYPTAGDKQNKFERLAPEQQKPAGQTDDPLANHNYDDRYERESKLFSRGENRGFGARAPVDDKTPANDTRRHDDNDATSRGSNYTYDPGSGPGTA